MIKFTLLQYMTTIGHEINIITLCTTCDQTAILVQLKWNLKCNMIFGRILPSSNNFERKWQVYFEFLFSGGQWNGQMLCLLYEFS